MYTKERLKPVMDVTERIMIGRRIQITKLQASQLIVKIATASQIQAGVPILIIKQFSHW